MTNKNRLRITDYGLPIKASQKSEIRNQKSEIVGRAKRGQSEMIGFAIILIMVVVIGVVFLSFSVNDQGDIVNNFELESFVQSILGYTTECEDSRGDYLPLRKVIFLCGEDEDCYSGEDSCEVINETLSGILENSWKTGEDWPIKGYSLQIFGEKKKIMNITEGIRTNKAKSSSQKFESGIAIDFRVYN